MTEQMYPSMTGLSDRDYDLIMLADADIEAQLIAIRELLRRNADAEAQATREIEALKEELQKATGAHPHHVGDQLVDRYHGTVFMDAAHSLSATGTLAPLVESSYFTQLFSRLAVSLQPLVSDPVLGSRADYARTQYWDLHLFFRKSGQKGYC